MRKKLLAQAISLALVGGIGVAFAAPAFTDRPNALLTIDQNRNVLVDRIVATFGARLEASDGGITQEQLRSMLQSLRADELLTASLAGSLSGLRSVLESAINRSEARVSPKAIGDLDRDLVYVPVTPCRLVDTRNTYAAVYQNGGVFSPSEIRTYTVQGGNGVCLTQLPSGAATWRGPDAGLCHTHSRRVGRRRSPAAGCNVRQHGNARLPCQQFVHLVVDHVAGQHQQQPDRRADPRSRRRSRDGRGRLLPARPCSRRCRPVRPVRRVPPARQAQREPRAPTAPQVQPGRPAPREQRALTAPRVQRERPAPWVCKVYRDRKASQARPAQLASTAARCSTAPFRRPRKVWTATSISTRWPRCSTDRKPAAHGPRSASR